ncbi:MAG: DUF3109 family protein [Ignavibacteriaceae bacterium]|nr:DUF3109 family protein [Ignavibacteriaceae bacterium]
MSENQQYKINGLKIDPVVFTSKFRCNCRGECCNYGVYTDFAEHQHIMSLKDELIPLMDETQTRDFRQWFEEPEEDPDFQSGIAVGTEIHQGKCVFLDKQGLCVIQKNSMLRGRHKWADKPLYCILFPFTIFEGSLTIDDEHIERLSSCNREGGETYIMDFCNEELIHFLGEEGYKQLTEYRQEYLSKTGK